MRRLLASGLIGAALVAVAAATAAAASPGQRRQASQARASTSVQMMIVGRARTLSSARTVRLGSRAIRIGRKHCSVPAATPLAGLLASGLPVRVTDASGCDTAAMFVRQVGPDRNRGIAGWEYKVGPASPSFGAGDPGQRLRAGTRLLWFWCSRATACQHTLALRASPGAPIRGTAFTVTVLGYDDNGHGGPVSGAVVGFAGQSATSGAGGVATLTAPAAPGRYSVSAGKPGLVAPFPLEVTVR
jgi:hypothetical protein